MKTECPFCMHQYEVSDELLDKAVECPECKEEFFVQVLSEEEPPIPPLPLPPPPPKTASTPLPTCKPTDDSSEVDAKMKNLFDPTEDEFVLRSLKRLKTSNLRVTILIVSLLSISAVLCFYKGLSGFGISCLLITLLILYHCFIVNIALSWLRGIYRNIMWFSFSQTMPETKLKK